MSFHWLCASVAEHKVRHHVVVMSKCEEAEGFFFFSTGGCEVSA